MKTSSALESRNRASANKRDHSAAGSPRDGLAKITREQALRLAAASEIQYLSGPELLAVQSILQHGDQLGHWQTLSSMCPPGQSKALKNQDIRHNIVRFLSDSERQVTRLSEQAISATEYVAQHLMPSSVAAEINDILNQGVVVCTRYLILLRIGPVGLGRKGRGLSLKPSNTRNIGYSYLPALVAIAASKWIASALSRTEPLVGDANRGGLAKYLSIVEIADLDRLSAHMKEGVWREADRMRILCERGYWTDVPFSTARDVGITAVAGERPTFEARKEVVGHKPLPDTYVSEMGLKSLWLIQELGHCLFTVGAEILRIWERTDLPSHPPEVVERRRIVELRDYLSTFVWRDSAGKPIGEPPFVIKLFKGPNKKKPASQGNSNVASGNAADRDNVGHPELDGEESEISMQAGADRWPPRNFSAVMGLFHNLQLAHLFLASLSMGGRKSELLSLNRSCIEYAPNGMTYASGRTFKLVRRGSGAPREWVLPDVVVEAIEQQLRLVRLCETIGPSRPQRLVSNGGTPNSSDDAVHLWGQVWGIGASKRTEPLTGVNIALCRYAKALNMETAPGGQTLRVHRFRKTIARLVGLAVSQSAKILMDVFGHESPEATLYYILESADLQADIEQVTRELRVMKAKEAIEAIAAAESTSGQITPDLGGYGGPAARTILNAIETTKEGLHRGGSEWGADTAIELAEILTLQGKAWQLVRRGVICTKFPGTESGPCNKSKGRPEPSRCQPQCKHRLEEAFLREDVDGAIHDSVLAYQDAEMQNEALMQAHWAGQIRAHINRFDDLRAKWASHPTVRKVIEDL